MEIKGLILLAGLATIFVSVNGVDEFIVEVLSPKGFRVSTANVPGIQRVGFRGNINTRLLGYETAQYTGDFALNSTDWWVYENLTASLNPGFTLYYRPQISSRTSGVRNFVREYSVPFDDTSLHSLSGFNRRPIIELNEAKMAKLVEALELSESMFPDQYGPFDGLEN